MSLPSFSSQQMNVFKMKEGRYLLYLDILGFSDLLKSQSPETIYAKIDTMLQTTTSWRKVNKDFDVLYFSDTIIFYQISKGWGSWAFSDVYAIGSMIWTALAAEGIPTRGAIAFGEFNVQADSSGKHNIFFGEALIEAYESEKAEENKNWIGINICPTAWWAVEYAQAGRLESLMASRQLVQNGDSFRLCPFRFVGTEWSGTYFHYHNGEVSTALLDWNAPHFRNEVKVLQRFSRIRECELSDSIKKKYDETWALFETMLEPKVLNWCLGLEV